MLEQLIWDLERRSLKISFKTSFKEFSKVDTLKQSRWRGDWYKGGVLSTNLGCLSSFWSVVREVCCFQRSETFYSVDEIFLNGTF